MLRLFWLTFGIVSLILGIIGIVLPLLPTTPFVLLAAAAFAKSSTKFYNFLIENKHCGPIIKNWKENRTVPPRAILAGVIMMSISIIVFILYFIYYM